MESSRKAQDWLNNLKTEAQFFREGKSPSLEIVEKLLDAFGRPDLFFDWRIVVGGTAGKGSTCAYIEETLLDNGKKVAVLSSPEIQVVTERIRINGKLIDLESFGKVVFQVMMMAEKLKIRPTYYEVITLAGIVAAKESGCEIFVAEVGMGGRLDAVNALKGKRIAVLTFVGEDHLEFFNYSVEKLAEEKAGIFTKNSVLNLSFEQKYCSILEKNAFGKIVYVKGIKEKLNKKIARKACEKILGCSDFVMTQRKLPCRWEKFITADGFQVFLEGAHSYPRFEYILPKLKKIHGKKVVIFAMTKNHDPESFNILLDFFHEVIFTQVQGKRVFWDKKELSSKLKRGIFADTPQEALIKAKEISNKIVVLGSFYLCGAIRENFYPSELIEKNQSEFF